MALDLCSHNCGLSSSVSPRISFSHDFSHSDVIPVEQLPFGFNSTTDFDFCVSVSESFELQSSSADELFSHGRILPTEVKKTSHEKQTSLPPPYAALSTRKNFNPKQKTKSLNDQVYEKQSSKSFWIFKRSTSCGNGPRRTFCPLPLLSRSNSTGSSAPSVKRTSLSKDAPNIKPISHKHSSTHSFLPNSYYQKPPLNHKNHGSYANFVRVNPVLNVLPANLFGLASIFSNTRDKTKK
ncbi:hypothetical protein VNO78_14681 [Psophocarpus tetragonolobus]|uniref:Uncharacterized protein n=1 Tax=Psophocarpus tetragonolobus TaxID=3891 RepID=A0AAN9SDW6_PSOTE